MDISFFRRGINLQRRTVPRSVEEVVPPGQVRLLLRQEAGPSCKAIVEAGAEVKVGEKIAEGIGACADLHASISGVVKSIEKLKLGDATTAEAIVIEGNGTDDQLAKTEAKDDPLALESSEIIERIRAAGIIRRGREPRSLAAVIGEATASRGFIAATGSAITRPVEHIALRFGDAEPALGSLKAVTAGIGDDVSDLKLGVDLLVKITGAEHVHFVFDTVQTAKAVEQLAADNDFNLVKLDGSNYPSLSTPLVAKTVSGREPEVAFKRVHESGTLVIDIDTLLQMVPAVRECRPVVDQVVVVCGPKETKALKVRCGTSLTEVAAAGSQKVEAGKILLGGLMMGLAQSKLELPLDKSVGALTLVSLDQVNPATNDLCISCGLCAEVCPARLVPGMLSRYCEFGEWELAEQAHLFTCIECGCCAYVCPAGRSMVHFMIHGKSEVLAMRGGKS
jgi:H+/Na+-translocating ferredoxin:NAD+ oxidoreductase subunit C